MDPSGSLAGAPAVGVRPQRGLRRGLRETIEAYLFLTPGTVLLVTFLVAPALWIFWLSLYKWNLIAAEPDFVGLKNYQILFTHDQVFRRALLNTLYYVAVSVPAGLFLGLLFAVLLTAKLPGRGLMRGVIFAPYVMPFVATIVVWAWMFNPEYGVFNAVLAWLHLPRLRWLQDPRTFMPSFILYSIWGHVGYNTVIFLAGLANMPPDLDEAARVDGAGPLRVFLSIKWPLLTPTTYLVLLVNLIAAFKVAQQILVVTGGGNGPDYSGETIGLYLYQQAFVSFKAGYAGAISVVLFVIILAVSIIQWRFLSRRVFYQ